MQRRMVALPGSGDPARANPTKALLWLLLSLVACKLPMFGSPPPTPPSPPPPQVWPRFHHDPLQTGRSQFSTSANAGTLKWKFGAGAGGVLSSPAVGGDGTIYVGSGDHNLYAVNSDGTQKWTFVTGNTVRTSPAIGADGTIYLGGFDGNLYAVKPDGTPLWKLALIGETAAGKMLTAGLPLSSPAIGADGTIYVGSGDIDVFAVNPDGTLKWKFYPVGSVASTSAIGTDGTIYFGSLDRFLYALKPDGTLKWVFDTGGSVQSSPAIAADGTIYIGSNGHDLWAVAPDGSQKWKFNTGGAVESSPAIAADGTVYVGSVDGNVYAVKPDGTQLWKFATGSDIRTSSPAIGADGAVYIGADGDHKIYALDSGGTQKWKFTAGGAVNSSAAIGSDGTIYVGSDDGNLYALGGAPALACCGFPNGGPTKLRFETTTGSGSCGSYHVGTGNIGLACAGLFFGGGGETVHLPAMVPDRGVSFAGSACSGTTLSFTPLTAAGSGSIRTCTSPVGTCTAAAPGTCNGSTFKCTGTGTCSGGMCTTGKIGIPCATSSGCDFDCANDHDCDRCTAGNAGAHCNVTKGGDHQCSCLFGAPLPVPNPTVPSASVCLINTIGNRVDTAVTGSGDCASGSLSLSLPLNVELYLDADVLGRRCAGGSKAGFFCIVNADCPASTCVNDPDIQPCPICNPTTSRCNGGPNEGAPCTAGDSASLGPAYPTSHDCPPVHVGAEIGGVALSFGLSTGTASKTSFSTGVGNGKSSIFCGSCKNPLGGFENPPFPSTGCTSDAQCTHAPSASCEQNLNGAFGHLDANSISETGTGAGNLTTGARNAVTLVSVFCSPPAYDATTDTNSGLPGPGAVSLPGTVQLLP